MRRIICSKGAGAWVGFVRAIGLRVPLQRRGRYYMMLCWKVGRKQHLRGGRGSEWFVVQGRAEAATLRNGGMLSYLGCVWRMWFLSRSSRAVALCGLLEPVLIAFGYGESWCVLRHTLCRHGDGSRILFITMMASFTMVYADIVRPMQVVWRCSGVSIARGMSCHVCVRWWRQCVCLLT